jgi:hypothetical protein
MIAGFSICESLQMLALTQTHVKPAFRSGRRPASPFLGHARHLFHLDAKNDGSFHTVNQP